MFMGYGNDALMDDYRISVLDYGNDWLSVHDYG